MAFFPSLRELIVITNKIFTHKKTIARTFWNIIFLSVSKKTASTIPVHCAHDRLADVTSLVEHPRNPNRHGDAQVALLAKIIRHTGWRSPIVVSKRSGFIVAGHGRLAAAKLLQVESVPVNDQDFATEADEWAHVLADNRLAELADTDGAALKDMLIDLDSLTQDFDMDLTGFDAENLERVINSFAPEPSPSENCAVKNCPHCGKEIAA